MEHYGLLQIVVSLAGSNEMIFKYKAYTNLLVELGRTDSVVEILELAIRDFLEKAEESEDPKAFVKSKCDQHGIMVSLNQPGSYYYQVILGHIANVYHMAENFLYEMQIEHNSLSSETWSFSQGKTKLSQTIEFLKAKNRFNSIDAIPQYLIDTFEYYHQLRVYFSHKKTTSENETENKWKKAKAHFDNALLSKYKIKDGPSQVLNLTFDDFFLFTQVSKELALYLSSLGHPDASELAKLIELKSLKKYENTVDRISSYLKTEYGFIKQNDSDNLADEINSHL